MKKNGQNLSGKTILLGVSGGIVMRIGLILFLIFGAFFEMLFRSSSLGDYIFPAGLILLGLYLVIRRSGLFSGRRSGDQPKDPSA